jgi:hypothetical protein
MKRKIELTIAITSATTAVVAATAVFAAGDDKYSLISPGGIAFSDFKGYEDWATVSSARTEEVLKVIVANPAMIKAYKAGIPGNGHPFRKAPRSKAPVVFQEEYGGSNAVTTRPSSHAGAHGILVAPPNHLKIARSDDAPGICHMAALYLPYGTQKGSPRHQ